MKLPNAKNAIVEICKLREYALSPTHPVGKNKARVFQSALGLTADDAELLRDWLLDAAFSLDVDLGPADEFGQRYQIDFEATTEKGKAIVRSAWMIRTGEDVPRLTTCYIL